MLVIIAVMVVVLVVVVVVFVELLLIIQIDYALMRVLVMVDLPMTCHLQGLKFRKNYQINMLNRPLKVEQK